MFAWSTRTGSHGLFVWRQAEGLRRWDELPSGSGVRQGAFSIYSDFSSTNKGLRFIGNDEVDCNWTATSNDDAKLFCEDGLARNPPSFIIARMRSVSLHQVETREILERIAICYSFHDSPSTTGELCVDEREGLPLSFAGHDFPVLDSVTVTALSVFETPPDVPLKTFGNDGETQRKLADLGLPTAALMR